MNQKFGWFDSGALYEALGRDAPVEEAQLEAGRRPIGGKRLNPHPDGAGQAFPTLTGWLRSPPGRDSEPTTSFGPRASAPSLSRWP